MVCCILSPTLILPHKISPAYDLFVINVRLDSADLCSTNRRVKPVSTMLQYRLYNGNSLPAGLQGFLKAGANIGSVIGQFAFGARKNCLLKS
jgi:hypothetical protein